MACPAENTWLVFLSGRLEEPALDQLERHLDGCASCQLLYAGLARRGAAPRAPVRPLELRPGTVVGRYLILGPIGRGGMGVVYKAFDPELDRPIALKLVGLGVLGDGAEQAGARLQREARTLARLSHPNVVVVHDVGSFEEDVFVAMEFVAGTTLRSWLRQRPRRPREVIDVFLAAGAGLAAAHRLGIVHRDFKPENVMVGDDGRVRVLDFGLARSVADAVSLGAGARRSAEMRATQEGAIAGTPAYMAPEQDAGERVDAKSDQYSFCAALYEALYDRLPYAADTYVEMAARRQDGRLDPAPPLGGVSGRTRRALMTGLEAAPADRHRDMETLCAALAAPRWTRRRTAAAGLLLAAAAGGWAGWSATRAEATAAAACDAAAAEVGRIWSPARRGAVVGALAASGHPQARAIGDQVAAGLDRWAAGWSAERRELCMAAVRGEQGTDENVADRLQCLERRLTNLDATVTIFTDALEPEIVGRATAVVDGMASPTACDALVKPAIGERQKEMWKPSIRDVVQAHLALAGGRPSEAEELASAAVDRSRASGQKEPLGAALLIQGKARVARGEFAAGRAALRDAIRVLTEVREDGLVVDAWYEIIASLALRERALGPELDDAVFGAEIAVLRLPIDDPDSEPRRAALGYWIGNARYLQGDSEAALEHFQRSLVEWNRAGRDRHRLEIAAVENSLGMVHGWRGDWPAARRNLERALAVWESFGKNNPNVGITLGNLAGLAARQGEDDRAEALLARAIGSLEAAGEAGRGHLAETLIQLGTLEERTGRCQLAGGHLARGRALAAEVQGEGSPVVGAALIGEGLCQLAAGRAREALNTIERARRLVAALPPSLTLAADADFALARALWRTGARRRALALAGRAREAMARIPGARRSLVEIEDWLAAARR